VATTKVEGVLPCAPARLSVIAPDVSPTIAAYAAAGALDWRRRPYRPGDLAGADLAFGASDDRAVNAAVADEARARRVPVLAVDDIPHCDFIAPALVRRGDLTVAISTHGRSPAMARRARAWLELTLPAHWAALLDVAATARAQLPPATRRAIPPDAWQTALDGEVEDLVTHDHAPAALSLLLARLYAAARRNLPGQPFDPSTRPPTRAEPDAARAAVSPSAVAEGRTGSSRLPAEVRV
jgi:siroheme synthase-like protein